MKVILNTEKSSFCFIDQFMFSISNQEYDINIEELSDELKYKIISGISNGILIVDDKKELAKLVRSLQPATIASPTIKQTLQQKEPIKQVVPNVQDKIQEDIKPLKELLKSSVSTIKKKVTTYSVAQIRNLLSLEKEGKNRKAVISVLAKLIEKHELQVLNNIGGSREENIQFSEDLIVKKSKQYLTEIEESGVEEISIVVD